MVKQHLVEQCPPSFVFFQIQFVGEDFLVCASEGTYAQTFFNHADLSNLHAAFGSHFTVKFTEVTKETLTDIPPYRLRTCPLTAYKTPKHLPAGKWTVFSLLNFVAKHNNWWKRDETAKRATASKACVFIHGSGIREDLNWTSQFRAYWGNLHGWFPLLQY